MGSWEYNSRGVVENTLRVTIEDLKVRGLLKYGYKISGTLTILTNGQESGSVGVTADVDPKGQSHVQFNYRRNGVPLNYRHNIELFPCPYGNHRYFIICRGCGRRVTALYLHAGYFSCRHCHRLVYQSSRDHRSLYQNVHRSQNLEARAKRLRERGHPRKANRVQWLAEDRDRMSWLDILRHLNKRGIGAGVNL